MLKRLTINVLAAGGFLLAALACMAALQIAQESDCPDHRCPMSYYGALH